MSIGALTTTFLPPSSCLARDNIWLVHTTCPDNDGCYYLLQGPPTTTDCLPKDYRHENTAYYSPGLCPAGYTPACSATSTRSRTITETMYTCCPSSFGCQTQKSTQFWPFQVSFDCASGFFGSGSIQVTESDRYSTSNRNYTYEKEGAINAFAVHVRFQSTDFVATSSTPGPTSTPASTRSLSSPNLPSSTNTPLASSTPSPLPPPSSPSRLNTGAKVGIAVGAVVGVVALIALFWLFYRIGKRRSQRTLETGQVQENPATEVQPDFATYYAAETWKRDAVGGEAEERYEMPGHTGPLPELSSQRRVQEM